MFSPIPSWADDYFKAPHILISAYPFNFYARYDRNDQQEWRRFDPRMYSLGLEFQKFELAFEVTTFSSDSTMGSIFIRREEKEYHFWGRLPVVRWPVVDLYLGGAVGSYDETITTTIASESKQSSSFWNWSSGLSAGVQYRQFEYLLLSLEARCLFGKDFDPQPQFGGLLRIGLRI